MKLATLLRSGVSTIPFVVMYYCPSCEKPHYLGAIVCPHCNESLLRKAA